MDKRDIYKYDYNGTNFINQEVVVKIYFLSLPPLPCSDALCKVIFVLFCGTMVVAAIATLVPSAS